MTHYTLGFLFNKTRDHVVLIRRAKKDWQQGLLNGIGGHIEPGESVVGCMGREFREETGTNLPTTYWHHAIRYTLPGAVLHICVAVDHDNSYCTKVRDTGEGEPNCYFLKYVLSCEDKVENLNWILPLLQSFLATPQAPFDIRQIACYPEP